MCACVCVYACTLTFLHGCDSSRHCGYVSQLNMGTCCHNNIMQQWNCVCIYICSMNVTRRVTQMRTDDTKRLCVCRKSVTVCLLYAKKHTKNTGFHWSQPGINNGFLMRDAELVDRNNYSHRLQKPSLKMSRKCCNQDGYQISVHHSKEKRGGKVLKVSHVVK